MTPDTRVDRLGALDVLRGLIIVIMAIDHASYFIAKRHSGEFWGVPLPLYDGAAAFLTRAVTHLAAPGFFFLLGVSVILLAESRGRSGWSDGRIRRYLVTRGLLLILLQHFVENPAWLLGMIQSVPAGMNPPGGGDEVWLHFGVLYGLGAAMIVCALLLRVPPILVGMLGVGAILATQVLTPGADQTSELFSPVVRLLLVPGQSGIWRVFYPLVPWAGVALLGMVFGRSLLRDPNRAFRALVPIGAVLLLLFVVLRIAGGFGNIHPPASFGWIDFFNLTKYPPALTFLLITLSVNLLLLAGAWAGKIDQRAIAAPLVLFGQTALFFYISHLYVFALIGFAFPRGTTLPMMYLGWALGLIILYPLCRAYRTFRRRTAPESLWRMI